MFDRQQGKVIKPAVGEGIGGGHCQDQLKLTAVNFSNYRSNTMIINMKMPILNAGILSADLRVALNRLFRDNDYPDSHKRAISA